MNRIFSRVWSKALGQLVVASELAKVNGAVASGQGRVPGAQVSTLSAALAVALAMGGLGVSGTALAADAVCYDPLTGTPVGDASAAGDQVVCGQGAVASSANAVAIGANAIASGANAVAIGANANAKSANAVAIGAAATGAGDYTVAIGNRAGEGTTTANVGNTYVGGLAGRNVAGNDNVAIGYGANNLSAATPLSYTTAVGRGAIALADKATALGYSSLAREVGSIAIGDADVIGADGVAVGTLARTGADGVAVGRNARSAGNADERAGNVAIGAESLASRSGTVAVGQGTESWSKSVSVGTGAKSGGNIGVGVAGGVAVGVDANATAGSATAIGYNAWAGFPTSDDPSKQGTFGVALGAYAAVQRREATAIGAYAQATAENAIALGGGQSAAEAALASGNRAIAVGRQSKATAADATAVGADALASGGRATALGYSSQASGANSISIGDSTASETDAIAVGRAATASAANAIAIGQGAQAKRASGVAIGDGVIAGNTGTNAYNVAIGAGGTQADARDNGANPTGAVAIGRAATAKSGDGAVAIGSAVQATGDGSVALGRVTNATGAGSLALGDSSNANASRAVALGSTSQATADSGIALGNGAKATAQSAIVVGRIARGSGQYSIAMGDNAQTTQDNAVAIGRNAVGSAVNTVVVGNGAVGAGSRAVALGYSSQAEAAGSISIGDSLAQGADAIAIGTGTVANGKQSISIGYGNQVSGDYSGAIGDPNVITGDGSYALGNDNTIHADDAGTFGNDNLIDSGADGSRVVGNNNTVSADGAMVLGNSATISAADGVALGSNTSVTQAGGVALGSGSVANTAAGIVGYVPAGASAGDAAAIAATVATRAAVDVGSRQITGVAAGTDDDDAVNVSQLKAVAAMASAGWTVTDADGNDANVGPGGTVTFQSGNSNILVAQTGVDDDGVVEITLSDDLDLTADGSVTIGDTLVNNDGVAVGPNVALGNTGLTVIGGTTTTVVDGDGLTSGTVVLSGVTNDVTGLSNTTLDAPDFATAGRAATEEQLSLVRDEIGEEIDANRTRYYSVNSTGGGNENNEGATGEDAIAAGKDAEAEGDAAVAMGYGASAAGDGAVAMGSGAQAIGLNSLALGAGATATHANSIALGANSVADGATLGSAAYSPTGDVNDVAGIAPMGEVSVGSAGNERRITNLAAGANDTDAVNVSQLKAVAAAAEAGAVHYFSVNDNGVVGGNYDNDGAQGSNSMAAGIRAAVAPGATNGTAVGTDSSVTAVGGTAIGYSSSATGQYAIAIGDSAATGTDAIAMGRASNSVASGVAIGYTARAVGANGVAIGRYSTASNNGIALGTSADANQAGSIAIGETAYAGVDAIHIGHSTVNGNRSGHTGAFRRGSTLIGDNANAQGLYSTVVGNGNNLLVNQNIQATGLLGQQFVAQGAFSNIYGAYNTVGERGTSTTDTTTNNRTFSGVAVTVTGSANEVQDSNGAFVAGYGNTVTNSYDDQINTSGILESINAGDIAALIRNDATKLGQVGVIGGANRLDNGNNVLLMGMRSNVSDASMSSVQGFNNQASGISNSSISGADLVVENADRVFVAGNNSKVQNATGVLAMGSNQVLGSVSTKVSNSILLGDNIEFATSEDGEDAIGIGNDTRVANGAVAVGVTAQALGERSIAVGYDAIATGSVAMGASSRAGNGGAAFGDGAVATYLGGSTVADTVAGAALGQNASADVSGAVALGTNASVTAENSVALGSKSVADGSTLANAAYSPTGNVNDVAGIAPVGEVSVGSAGSERRITNVAAGANDTDAVNVSQLRAVEGMASAGWNVTDADGNTANIGPDGTVTFEGDGNITVTQTGTDDDGVVEITLSDDLDLTADGSVTIGDTVMTNDGVVVGPNVTLGNTGLTVIGGTTTTVVDGDGLTSGTVVLSGVTNDVTGLSNTTLDAPDFATAGRAATEEQLDLVNQAANAGWNAADADGNVANIGPDGTVTFESGNGNIAVAQTGVDDDGVVEITLSDDLDLTADGSVTIGDTLVNNDGVAVGPNVALGNTGLTVIGGTTTTVVDGDGLTSGTVVLSGVTNDVTGLSNTTLDAPDFATAGRAATEEQLDLVNQAANAGWNAADADGNVANIGPDGTVTFESGNGNIAVAQTGVDDDGVVEITLSDDLDLTADGSVTIGDTVMTNDGVVVGPNVTLGNTGLTVIGGTTTTVVDGDGLTSGTVVLSGVTNDVTGLSNTTLDAPDFATAGRAATEEQLSLVRDEIGEEIDANRTRYYSVNSTGGGNEDNDGATGEDAIAAGKDAEAEGDAAVAMGYGASAAGDGAVAMGSGAQAIGLNSLALGAGATATHANSIALGAGSATTVGAQASYDGAYVGTSSSTGEVNVGGRQITGVAPGSAPTDAVNVSQLQSGVDYAITESKNYTDTQIENVNNAITNLDNRVTAIEGDIIDIRGDITRIEDDIIDIRGDITDLGDRVTTIEGDVANLTVTVSSFDQRINAVSNGSDGMFQVSQEGPITKPQPTGTNSSAGGNGAVASGDNSLAVGNQAVASGDNSVALGQGAVASHDNSVALGQGSKTTVGAQTGYVAAYVGTSNSTGEVNVGGRTISGVAPGIAPDDAVNVSQLRAGVNYAIEQANAYTDSRFEQLYNDVWLANEELRQDMYSAVATALAAKQAPWVPGKTTYYAGLAGYKGQGAIGISLRRTADNGRWSLEGGFSKNRDGNGVFIGIGGVLGD